MNNFFPQCFSDQSSFWYYNTKIAWTDAGLANKNSDINKLRTRENFLSHNVIIAMTNAGNLWQFDKGFSQQAFHILNPPTADDYVRFYAILKELRQQATWEEAVKDDFEQHISWDANDILE